MIIPGFIQLFTFKNRDSSIISGSSEILVNDKRNLLQFHKWIILYEQMETIGSDGNNVDCKI